MTLQIIQAPSPNFNDRLHPLDMLVLHYTGMKDGLTALARMQDLNEPRVSAHYMVEEDGRVFQLVAEDKRAWQAGRSWWRGDEDINSRSIGVEIVNGGHDEIASFFVGTNRVHGVAHSLQRLKRHHGFVVFAVVAAKHQYFPGHHTVSCKYWSFECGLHPVPAGNSELLPGSVFSLGF